MRGFALLLLLVNLAALFWMLQKDAVFNSDASAINIDNVGELILLSELPQKTELVSEESHLLESSSPPMAESVAEIAETTPEISPETTPEIIAEVATEEVVLAVDQEQLQEDSTSAQANLVAKNVAETKPADLPVPMIPVKPPTIYCGVLGPVESGSEARKFIDALNSGGVRASLRREDTTIEGGFWVIIPPYESQGAAKEAVTALRQQGITDIRRFFKGELRNGISLGMFSRQANAERRHRQIVRKGFPAELLPRHREVFVHWIDYRARGETGLDRLTTINRSYPDVERRDGTCPRIVTTKGIL